MFRNLEAEMIRAGVSRKEVSAALGVTQTTLSLKLNHKSPITLDEAKAIKSVLGTAISIEELFETPSTA